MRLCGGIIYPEQKPGQLVWVCSDRIMLLIILFTSTPAESIGTLFIAAFIGPIEVNALCKLVDLHSETSSKM